MAHHHALSLAMSGLEPGLKQSIDSFRVTGLDVLILFFLFILFDIFDTCLGQAFRNLNKLLCEPPLNQLNQLAHSETLIFNVLLGMGQN